MNRLPKYLRDYQARLLLRPPPGRAEGPKRRGKEKILILIIFYSQFAGVIISFGSNLFSVLRFESGGEEGA
jgi:hypothetical protein